jgi:hypothetical protein
MESEVVRVGADLLNTIRIYAEIEKKSNVEMVNDLLKDALDQYFLLRSGGAVFTVPNPQFIMNMDKEKAAEFVDILNETAAKLRKLNTGNCFAIEQMIAFFEYRFFMDSEDQRNQFQKFMMMDKGMNPKAPEAPEDPEDGVV